MSLATTLDLDATTARLAERDDALQAMKRLLLRGSLDGEAALVLSSAVIALEAESGSALWQPASSSPSRSRTR